MCSPKSSVWHRMVGRADIGSVGAKGTGRGDMSWWSRKKRSLMEGTHDDSGCLCAWCVLDAPEEEGV